MRLSDQKVCTCEWCYRPDRRAGFDMSADLVAAVMTEAQRDK